MNSKIIMPFNIIAIAAVVLLFGSGSIVAGHQALAVVVVGPHGGIYHGHPYYHGHYYHYHPYYHGHYYHYHPYYHGHYYHPYYRHYHGHYW